MWVNLKKLKTISNRNNNNKNLKHYGKNQINN